MFLVRAAHKVSGNPVITAYSVRNLRLGHRLERNHQVGSNGELVVVLVIVKRSAGYVFI